MERALLTYSSMGSTTRRRCGPWVGGLLLGLALSGCAEAVTPLPALTPQGSTVEFAMDSPSRNSHEFLGFVEVAEESKETYEATNLARTQLRNKAADLGASLVKVEYETGERVWFEDRVRVRVVGKAFRAKD